MRRLAWLAAVACVLAGCTSIPLSTMWMMRSFTLDDFFMKEPHDLRVAIRTDDRVKRGPDNPMIDIRIDGVATKPVCYAFALVPVDARGPAELTLDALPAHRRWYAFGLSKQGTEAFERARREVRIEKGTEARFELNVTMTGVLDFADGQDSAPMRVDLALDRKDGYFTLIKETTLRSGTTKSASRDAKPETKNDKQPCPLAAS